MILTTTMTCTLMSMVAMEPEWEEVSVAIQAMVALETTEMVHSVLEEEIIIDVDHQMIASTEMGMIAEEIKGVETEEILTGVEVCLNIFNLNFMAIFTNQGLIPLAYPLHYLTDLNFFRHSP